MSDQPVVELEDVTVTLGDVTALRTVSADLEAGRLVGLIGPNGAGKTTLLRTITAAVSPSSGTVRIAGESIDGLSSRAVSRRVAVVPQDPTLSFAFDVREIVAMGRTPYTNRFGGGDRADADAVTAAMERTDVSRFADRPITDVSGGERQRVLLARAIAQDTPVLLLDEPTASLDVNHRIRTFGLVRELVADGRTVVAAIHDLGLAARFCDELLLLSDGRQIARGSPADVLTPARIEAAYGATAVVTTNPVTGTPTVTALPDRPAADGRIHVLGLGRAAVGAMYRLRVAGYEVSVGPVPAGSTLAQSASQFGCSVTTIPAIGTPPPETLTSVESALEAADLTVLAGNVDLAGSLDLPSLLGSDALIVCVGDYPPIAEGVHRVDTTIDDLVAAVRSEQSEADEHPGVRASD